MSRPCDTGMCDVSRCTDSDCLQPLSPCIEEKVYLSSPSFNIVDRNAYTNNTFINRYLESRKPRIPQELALMNKLADIETVRRLKRDIKEAKQKLCPINDK